MPSGAWNDRKWMRPVNVCLIGCRNKHPDPCTQPDSATSAPNSHDLEIFISTLPCRSWSLKSTPAAKKIAGAPNRCYTRGTKTVERARAANLATAVFGRGTDRHRSERVCLASGLVRGGRRHPQEPTGLQQHGDQPDLCRTGRALQGVRGMAAEKIGFGRGRSSRVDDAEHP